MVAGSYAALGACFGLCACIGAMNPMALVLVLVLVLETKRTNRGRGRGGGRRGGSWAGSNPKSLMIFIIAPAFPEPAIPGRASELRPGRFRRSIRREKCARRSRIA